MSVIKAKSILKEIWQFCSNIYVPQRRPKPIDGSINTKNMIIKRFKSFPKKNEEKILEECGYPKSTQFFELQPFYKGDNTLAFLFVDDEGDEFDIVWIEKPDVFSLKVYEALLFKSALVEILKDKHIAVFVKEEKTYKYYGVYKLENPFVAPGGMGMAVNVETPLVFRLEKEDLITNK